MALTLLAMNMAATPIRWNRLRFKVRPSTW